MIIKEVAGEFEIFEVSSESLNVQILQVIDVDINNFWIIENLGCERIKFIESYVVEYILYSFLMVI